MVDRAGPYGLIETAIFLSGCEGITAMLVLIATPEIGLNG